MPEIAGAAPVETSDRHDLMDALRGFALFGIFLANIRSFSGWDFLSTDQRVELAGDGYALIDVLHLAIIDGKFYTLFAFLFGLGFALQLARLEDRGAAATRVYLRRTTILLAIGVVHMFVFWLGDILLPYALLGFVLLAVRRWSDQRLLIVAAAAFVTPLLGYALFWLFGVSPNLGIYPIAFSLMPAGAQDPMVDLQLTDWGDRLQAAFAGGVLRIGYLFESWRFPKLLAIMLLGMWAGRRLIHGELLGNTRLLASVLLVGGASGLIAGPMLAHLGGLGFYQPHSAEGFAAVAAYTFAVIPLGLAYAAAFALLWRHAASVLCVLAAPGRMALTNYLLQTLVGLTVFYGVGFGLAGTVSIQALLGIAAGVYAVQTILSNLWLRFFNYGPMEWAWRGLTYGEAPRMLRAAPEPVS